MRYPNSLSSPQDIAISAFETVDIGAGARVLGSKSGTYGKIAAFANPGLLTKTGIGSGAKVGDIWSRPGVLVTSLGEVRGNVTSQSSVIVLPLASVVGTIAQNTAVNYTEITRQDTLPTTPAQNVSAALNEVRTLEPGYYKRVDVLLGGTVKFKPGVYYVETFVNAIGGKVEFQNADKPVVLYVRDILTVLGTFTETATKAQIGNVLWGFLGTNSVTFASPLIGTVVAPQAAVTLGGDGGVAPFHRGAVFAKSTSLSGGKTLTHAPFPAILIKDVRVSKTNPCVNEPFTVEVETATVNTAGGEQDIEVMLNGTQGKKHVFSFPYPDTYEIRASAFKNGIASGQTVKVAVQACAAAQVFPRLSVQSSAFEPYSIEFLVMNEADLTGTNRRFVWNFGDGSAPVTTSTPYVEHSYASKLDATTEKFSFESTVTVSRDGKPDTTTSKTINFTNQYAETRARGFVRPPLTGDVRLQAVGGSLRGSFSLRNLETGALAFNTRTLERHFCDPDRDPETLAEDNAVWRVGTLASGQPLVLGGSSSTSQELILAATSFGSNVCAVTLNLSGTTSTGIVARAAVHFETPEPGLFATPVTSNSLRNMLNSAASQGLLEDPDHVDERELKKLWKQGLISDSGAVDDIDDGALQSGEVIGAPCDPEQDVVSNDAIACQVTDEWTVAPPLVRNALKGDIFIVAGCGPIGQLLRVVLPRQAYSHEAIMTRNYYSLSHTTAESKRIINSVGQSVSNNMDENTLRYGWPGAVHASVNAGFNGRAEIDPDGKVWKISGFSATGSQCQGDESLNPPIVIRPPPGSGAAVRAKLHQAADIAANIESHYRFFAYSQGNVAFDAANNFDGKTYVHDGELAEVSTTFIWHALKAAGITLEGATLEQPDIAAGARLPVGRGIIDGLYFYSEAERREGAKQIYSSTYSSVKAAQADSGINGITPLTILPPGVWSDQADDIASQFTNCFAVDKCGESGAQDDDYENPGSGVTVSPDNFRFWDSPATGGVFGDEELLLYRAGDYRRVYRWKATAGAGSVRGNVTLPDGSPVPGALVTVAGQEDGSRTLGEFAFATVKSGEYEARAEKSVLRSDHTQPCPADGSALCDNLVDVERITVVAGQETTVNLVLEPEAAVPPPTTEVFGRNIVFSGTAHLHDDEVIGSENGDFDLTGVCALSPLNRNQRIKLPAHRICTGGEVVLEVWANCELLEDNQTAVVTFETKFLEGTSCGTDDVADTGSAGPLTLQACSDPAACQQSASGSLSNSGIGGGDTASWSVTIQNVRGDVALELPNVQPENLRRVTISGDIEIIDDEIFGDERDSFVLGEECIVDPFDRDQTISWSQCVGGEARLKLEIKCTLARDNVGVNVRVVGKLFEGVSCVSDDEDGRQTREFVLTPCNGSCVPEEIDFTVDNNDKDKGIVSLSLVNEQR